MGPLQTKCANSKPIIYDEFIGYISYKECINTGFHILRMNISDTIDTNYHKTIHLIQFQHITFMLLCTSMSDLAEKLINYALKDKFPLNSI